MSKNYKNSRIVARIQPTNVSLASSKQKTLPFKKQPRRGRRRQIAASLAYMNAFDQNHLAVNRGHRVTFNNNINKKRDLDIHRIGVSLDHLDVTHVDLAKAFGCQLVHPTSPNHLHPHLLKMVYFPRGNESMRLVEIERKRRLSLLKKGGSGAGAETRVTKLGMSDCIELVLKYTIVEILTTVAGTSASVKMNNCAYDIDTALASTAMPYFSEIAAFTGRSRVLNFKIQGKIANSEAFPVAVLAMLTVSSIGATAVSEVYAGNPHTSTMMLGAINGENTGTISKKASIMAIAGSKQALYDDAYTSSNTSNSVLSSALTYAYIATNSTAAMTALGVTLLLEVSVKTLMYRRISLLGREEDMFEEDKEEDDPVICDWRSMSNEEKRGKRLAMLQYLSDKNQQWNLRRDKAQPVAILDQLQKDYDELNERLEKLEKPGLVLKKK